MNWASEQSARDEIQQLVQKETACLNKADLDGWISLFTEDGYYWMPLEEEHMDPEKHDSLIYDNRALMVIRKFNLGNPLSPSMQLKVSSVRILSDIEITPLADSANEVDVSAFFIAVIYQQQKIYYAGKMRYRVVNTVDGLKIRVKRVDLLDADAPLDSIMMYL